MEKGEGKSTVSRRIKILELLKTHGQVNVNELSESLGVTGVTIRNDLAQLEKKRVLIRARGGAIKLEQNFADEDYPLSDKQKKHLLEKREIGKMSVRSGFPEEYNPRFGNRQKYSIHNWLQGKELGQVTIRKSTRFCAHIH